RAARSSSQLPRTEEELSAKDLEEVPAAHPSDRSTVPTGGSNGIVDLSSAKLMELSESDLESDRTLASAFPGDFGPPTHRSALQEDQGGPCDTDAARSPLGSLLGPWNVTTDEDRITPQWPVSRASPPASEPPPHHGARRDTPPQLAAFASTPAPVQ